MKLRSILTVRALGVDLITSQYNKIGPLQGEHFFLQSPCLFISVRAASPVQICKESNSEGAYDTELMLHLEDIRLAIPYLLNCSRGSSLCGSFCGHCAWFISSRENSPSLIGQAEKKDAINSRVIPKTVKNKHTRHRLKEKKRMVRPCRLRILSSCHLCFKEMEGKREAKEETRLRLG